MRFKYKAPERIKKKRKIDNDLDLRTVLKAPATDIEAWVDNRLDEDGDMRLLLKKLMIIVSYLMEEIRAR
jgi:hypothetical protein